MALSKLEERVAELLADPARRDDPVLPLVAALAEERQKLIAALEEASRTDTLTGLANRRAMQERLSVEANRSFRNAKPFILIMIDVDHFMAINETHGHEAGDVVLKEVARVLRSNLRNFDLCARWGGEEFLVLLAETPPEKAFPMADKLRTLVAATSVTHQGTLIAFTISAGLAVHDPTESVDHTLREADAALRAAKGGGRNRVVAR